MRWMRPSENSSHVFKGMTARLLMTVLALACPSLAARPHTEPLSADIERDISDIGGLPSMKARRKAFTNTPEQEPLIATPKPASKQPEDIEEDDGDNQPDYDEDEEEEDDEDNQLDDDEDEEAEQTPRSKKQRSIEVKDPSAEDRLPIIPDGYSIWAGPSKYICSENSDTDTEISKSLTKCIDRCTQSPTCRFMTYWENTHKCYGTAECLKEFSTELSEKIVIFKKEGADGISDLKEDSPPEDDIDLDEEGEEENVDGQAKDSEYVTTTSTLTDIPQGDDLEKARDSSSLFRYSKFRQSHKEAEELMTKFPSLLKNLEAKAADTVEASKDWSHVVEEDSKGLSKLEQLLGELGQNMKTKKLQQYRNLVTELEKDRNATQGPDAHYDDDGYDE